jgi:acetyl-CoA carboxylase biotin carboxylase subunit
MIAKLVVWGRTRKECIERTDRALREYRITGIKTSIGFFRKVLKDENFLAGEYTTGFITPEFLEDLGEVRSDEVACIAAAIAQLDQDLKPARAAESGSGGSTWKRAATWRSTHRMR